MKTLERDYIKCYNIKILIDVFNKHHSYIITSDSCGIGFLKRKIGYTMLLYRDVSKKWPRGMALI